MVFKNIKAVVFDLDWTLVNSTIDFKEMKRKILRYLATKGIRDKAFAKVRTIEIVKRATALFEERGSAEIKETINRIMNQVELENVDKTTPIPGARETLQEIKARGIKIGVLTRGHRAYALKALQVTGLYSSVDLILARDQTEKSKPDPRPLLQAIDMLQIKPEEALMVGDSTLDAQCAKDANVTFIGVLSGFSSYQAFKEIGCKTVISTIRDLTKLIRGGT